MASTAPQASMPACLIAFGKASGQIGALEIFVGFYGG